MKKNMCRIVFIFFILLGLTCFEDVEAETQKAIFPFLGAINITQTSDGLTRDGYTEWIDETKYTSHYIAGSEVSYSVDFIDANGNRSIYAYAPFDAYMYDASKIYGLNGNAVLLQSKEKVLLANGTKDYVFMMFVHDNSKVHYEKYLWTDNNHEGIKAGQPFYLEGNHGVGVDNYNIHMHFDFGIGTIFKDPSNPSILKNDYELFANTNGFAILKNTANPFEYLFFDPSITFSSSANASLMNQKAKAHQLADSSWLNTQLTTYTTNWVCVSANDESNSLNVVKDNTDTDTFLYGEVRYNQGYLLDGAGCFLSTKKIDVENATPSDVGSALHVADPASSFISAGNGYQDADGYRYTKIFYTAQESGIYGFNTALTPGTQYYYRFYALCTVNGTQEITYSDVKEFTTTGIAPVTKYSLTVCAGTGGTVNTTASGLYEADQTITLIATPDTDYLFAEWSSSNGGTFANAAGTPTTFTMPAADTTITATFVEWPFNLVISPSNSFNQGEAEPIDFYITSNRYKLTSDNFVTLLIDGQELVSGENTFTLEEDSLTIHMSVDYLSRLPIGDYKVDIEFRKEKYLNSTLTFGITLSVTEREFFMILPNALITIEAEAFVGVKTDAILLPDTVVTIGSRAFADSENLQLINIPASVDYIADDAFEGCPPELTFIVYRGSLGHEYAELHGYSCIVREPQ